MSRVAAILIACLSTSPAVASDPPSTPTTWEDLASRGDGALVELQKSLPPPAPGGTFTVDQDSDTLRLLDGAGHEYVRANFAVVGTYSTRSDSWLWGWANETADPDPRMGAVKAYGQAHQLERLTTGRVPCTRSEAERIWGVALLLSEADGWYRTPISDTSWVYLALYDIQRIDR